MFLTPKWVSRQKDVKFFFHRYIKTKSWSWAFYQPQNNVFSIFPFSRGGKIVSFLSTLIWSELNCIAICLCNTNPDLIFLLNQFNYGLFIAMRSVTGNHTMDLFCLLKESFKNLLFDPLITGRSFDKLSYLSSCLLSQRWRFQRIRSNLLQGIESDLAYTKG